MTSFQKALGQFLVYVKAVNRKLLDWTVYLAIPSDTYQNFFAKFDVIQELINDYKVKMIVFGSYNEEIILWKD